MARIITPGSSQPQNNGPRRSQPFFVIDLVHRHGMRALFAILVAALFAFSPLTALYWFSTLRLQSVITTTLGEHVVVKSAQSHNEQEQEEPGETALLQVRCDIPDSSEWRELLKSGDPASTNSLGFESRYVRNEKVYVRKSGSSVVPFALLGSPPVSVWLPAGDYEILVVYEAPRSDSRIWVPGPSFPLLSAFAECSLESRQTTVCRVQLPHYETGNPDVLLGIGNLVESAERKPLSGELVPLMALPQKGVRPLATGDESDITHNGDGVRPRFEAKPPLIADCETMTAIPTPGGYVLNLPEPLIHHQQGHRGCVQDFEEQQSVRREWTRDQIATLRNWLPNDAVQAKGRLSVLIDRLLWREFLEGWYCYAAAGISGLIFTKWGAIRLLEPWRRGRSWYDSLSLIIRIFLFSVAAWFVLQMLTKFDFGHSERADSCQLLKHKKPPCG